MGGGDWGGWDKPHPVPGVGHFLLPADGKEGTGIPRLSQPSSLVEPSILGIPVSWDRNVLVLEGVFLNSL